MHKFRNLIPTFQASSKYLLTIALIALLASSCSSSHSNATNGKVLSSPAIQAMINKSFASGVRNYQVVTSAKVGKISWKYTGQGSININSNMASQVALSQSGKPYSNYDLPNTSQLPILQLILSNQEIYIKPWGVLEQEIAIMKKSWISISLPDTLNPAVSSPLLLLASAVVDPFTFIYLLEDSGATAGYSGASTSNGQALDNYDARINLVAAESGSPGTYSGLISVIASIIKSPNINVIISTNSAGVIDFIHWSYKNTKQKLNLNSEISFVGKYVSAGTTRFTTPATSQTIDLVALAQAQQQAQQSQPVQPRQTPLSLPVG